MDGKITIKNGKEVVIAGDKEYLKVGNKCAEIEKWDGETPVIKTITMETVDPKTGARSVTVKIPSFTIGVRAQERKE